MAGYSDAVVEAIQTTINRVLVGEVRGKEAFDLMQAMNTGVDGSMATIHANSPADALKKWADYVAMPVTRRFPSGKRRVTGIAECLSASKTVFETAILFDAGKDGQIFKTKTPPSSYLSERFARAGVIFHKTYDEFIQAMKVVRRK